MIILGLSARNERIASANKMTPKVGLMGVLWDWAGQKFLPAERDRERKECTLGQTVVLSSLASWPPLLSNGMSL